MGLRRVGLGTVLAVTMAVSAFAGIFFSVLATTLRTEFDLSRGQIGALVAISMGTGAALSPTIGAHVDRSAPQRAVAVTLGLSAIGFVVLGFSSIYLGLLTAAVVSGIAQATSNPATNRLIMSQARAGHRGLLTGIKQAGVQASTFLGGLLLPLGAASRLGWQGTARVVPVVSGLGLSLLWIVFPRDPPVPPVGRGQIRSIGPAIRRIAVYSAILGVGTGALMTHVPSFTQETFGWSQVSAGSLVSVYGAVGLITRLTAGSASERWLGHRRTLILMAAATALAGLLLAVIPSANFLLPVAVLIGIGPMAYNVIANLATMELSPVGMAGKGSGVVMSGFLGGVATGAPLLGLSVDALGSYRQGWAAVGGLGILGIYVAYGMERSAARLSH